jgi:hypothetical protein
MQTRERTRRLVDGDMYRGRCSSCRSGVDLPGSDLWHRGSEVWRRLLRDAHRPAVSASASQPLVHNIDKDNTNHACIHQRAAVRVMPCSTAAMPRMLHDTPITRCQPLSPNLPFIKVRQQFRPGPCTRSLRRPVDRSPVRTRTSQRHTRQRYPDSASVYSNASLTAPSTVRQGVDPCVPMHVR